MKRKIANLLLLCTVMLSTSVLLSSCSVKDADIEKAIAEKVTSTPEMSGLAATVKDGVVSLSGECKDDACKTSCETAIKGMKGVKSVVSTVGITPPPAPVAPVEIAADDPLTQAVADASKDFTGVTATVKDGVVTLKGEIKKMDLPKLMQAIMASKPKKVDNQLVIK
ncbi:hypothetical protein BH10BAC2_BH10BAC2_40200 [soil metagenome]